MIHNGYFTATPEEFFFVIFNKSSVFNQKHGHISPYSPPFPYCAIKSRMGYEIIPMKFYYSGPIDFIISGSYVTEKVLILLPNDCCLRQPHIK